MNSRRRPTAKSTVRFVPPSGGQKTNLGAMVASARLTALGYRRLATQCGENTERGKQALKRAGEWDARAAEYTRKRCEEPAHNLTITLQP